MLRERILGDSLFDVAFREYARRWMFRHPQPADFFRSIEDGAGERLNHFWRGWFYTTEANDQAIARVEVQRTDSMAGPEVARARGRHYVRVALDNRGGLVLPVELGVTFADGTTQRIRLPADVWRRDEKRFVHGFFTDREVTEIVIDPDEAFADVDRGNNTWRAPGARPIS